MMVQFPGSRRQLQQRNQRVKAWLTVLYKRVLAVSLYSRTKNYYRSAQILALSPGFVYYWVQKSSDPLFHPNRHGGKRIQKFTEGEKNAIKLILWMQAKYDPTTRLGEYTRVIRR